MNQLASTQQQLAQKTERPPETVQSVVLRYKSEIANALPKHISPDRMARIALTELRKNPALNKCDPYSFMGALIQCAQLGLEPGSGTGHAYLIPFKNQVQMIIGYQGMIDLAYRSGKIDSIYAMIVYEGDQFEYYIENGFQKMKHVPNFNGPREDENIRLVYAAAQIKNGGAVFVMMTVDEVKKIEKQSRKGSGMSAVWRDHFAAMAKKTAIRQLYKTIPRSVEMSETFAHTESEMRANPLEMRQIAEDTLTIPALPVEEQAAIVEGSQDTEAPNRAADLSQKLAAQNQPPKEGEK